MEQLHHPPEACQRPIRALVEVIDGELKIYPIADSDFDEQRILDGLRFFQEARAS